MLQSIMLDMLQIIDTLAFYHVYTCQNEVVHPYLCDIDMGRKPLS